MARKSEIYIRIAQKAVQLGNEIEHVKGRFPTFLVGLIGEYLAMAKLAGNGVKFYPKGGQACYDLQLEQGTKIEVRTSLLKNEGVFFGKRRIFNYGWRLKDRGKDVEFDYVICIALDRGNLEDSKFYILTKSEVQNAPSIEIGRFKKVEKRLWIYPSLETMNEAKEDKPQYVPKWEENINTNKDEYLLDNRWDLLTSIENVQ